MRTSRMGHGHGSRMTTEIDCFESLGKSPEEDRLKRPEGDDQRQSWINGAASEAAQVQ